VWTVSIQTRLLASYLLLAGILAALAIYAIIQIAAINHLTSTIRTKWFAGTGMLGEMADLLSEIHIDQLHTLVQHPEVTRAEADALAEEHIKSLEALKAAYEPLIQSARERSLFDAFATTSNTYVTLHQAFARTNNFEPQGANDHVDERLGGAYLAADHDVDALIATNATGADADAQHAQATNDLAFDVLVIGALAGLTLVGWMIFVVRRRIALPLGAITKALSRLAEGHTEITVPGADRGDEIGAMAQAFDVFRHNAMELATAYKAAEEAHAVAQSLARHDALTGLPNRRVFSEKLEEAIVRVKDGDAVYAILLVDLDRFKPVNDVLGHAAGDIVLCEVAERLKAAMRKEDVVARLGGDEFAIISTFEGPAASFAEATRRLANRLIAAIAEPIKVGDSIAEVGASVGIADCPIDGIDADTLLHAADIAMYRAKRDGRGTFRFFEPSMDLELKARIEREADLRRGVAANEIEPHYQPLMALGDDRLIGFEILARWRHPRRGVVMPAEFIPLAEEIGVIEDLTYRILRHACRDARTWAGDLMLSLNVSALQLRDKLLPTRILAILVENDFAPRRLQVEITETALVSEMDTAREILGTLQGLGIRIALDDFGTGYSSLYHLRELHLDQVKIDRSFIESMRQNPESEKIVNAILGLTKSLGLPTTAEGIEDADTLSRVVEGGCTYGQGFYFAAAMPAAEAATFSLGQTKLAATA
jgi:diguanylate cyclase (GGDEF)-like protein